MGEIIQGILGGFKGTAGTVVGFVRNGKSFIRGKNMSFTDLKSVKQLEMRNRFKGCSLLAKLLKKEVIYPIWNKADRMMTGYNLFIKKNWSVFDGDGFISEYENLVISVGELPLPKNLAVVNNGSGNGAVTISWSDNSGFDIAQGSDLLRLVVINEGEPEVISGLVAHRSDSQANVQLPYVAGGEMHLYVFFQDADGSKSSPSAYLPLTFPAN